MSTDPALRPPANPAAAPEENAAPQAGDPELMLGRETSILEFNRRVLAQALRHDVPLLERLRYICIVSSNIDEFFEVRVADFIEAARQPDSGVSNHHLAAVAEAPPNAAATHVALSGALLLAFLTALAESSSTLPTKTGLSHRQTARS